jgi:iron complex outermembrane receptor protein
MRQTILFLTLIFCSVHIAFSQKATIRGTVKDGKTGELLESAVVLQPPSNGTRTDLAGNYELQVEPGEVTLAISYIGMNSDTQHVKVKSGELKILNINLGGNPMELQTVVIGESKVGVKVQKITQSIDVMKPRMLESNNITSMQQAVTKIPGVTVLDGQMSIRGGSGYAYGSGSRVTLVVDEMPLMTVDRGEIRWPLIPVENTEQMEIIKGASTMQYGSSALNGVLNVTTAYARDTPSTRFTFFYEGIGKPPVDSFQWWKRKGRFFDNPNTLGMSFLHKQKFGDVDVVVSGMMQGSQSHLNQEYDYFTRFNGKVRWQPRKLKRLTLELAFTSLYRKSGTQFYWQDGGHPYLSASGVDIDERYFYMFIDPKFRFVDKSNSQHKLFTRIYRQVNMGNLPSDDIMARLFLLHGTGPDFWTFSVDYQFRHDFGKIFRLQFGVKNDHSTLTDGTLGSHKVDYGGGFVQGEINYKWFTFNTGVREEYVRLDSALTPTIPVFRAGVNFEIRKYNYIRASFGQAFRVPSIAERFVTYNLAGIRILPNYNIRPESGFTAELGYKRSFKIGSFLGYFDAVAFWTEFKDMIEFQFGTRFDSTGFYPYFQSQNVSRARIFGWETSLVGEGTIGPVNMTAMVGYTYVYGVDLNDTSWGANVRNSKVANFLKDAFVRFALPTGKDDYTWDSLTAGMLKYRNPHTFKADLDFLIYGKYHVGTSLQYYSYMTQVDKIFGVFIPDVNKQRMERRNKGDAVWDLRLGYDFNRNFSLNFMVKNVLNSNYAIRIAKPDKPRSFTVQMIVNFGGTNKKVNTRTAAGMGT